MENRRGSTLFPVQCLVKVMDEACGYKENCCEHFGLPDLRTLSLHRLKETLLPAVEILYKLCAHRFALQQRLCSEFISSGPADVDPAENTLA